MHNLYIAMTHITEVQELHRHLKNELFYMKGNIYFRVPMADLYVEFRCKTVLHLLQIL